jgi:hypothetical protein
MIVSKTAKIWLDYHRAHSKNNTVRAYEWTIGKFCIEFGDTDLLDLSVDEIIFRTTKIRNRLILELMARGGMRIGEVLKLTPADIKDRKFF